MSLTKRMARMFAWIEANPYTVYGAYNDELSDDQAQMLVSGNFEAFDESWFEVELNASDYAEWSDWERDFLCEFYPDLDIEFSDLPEAIQEFCLENRFVDCSDLLRTCCQNWRGHVCARLIKRNGEYVEFPAWNQDKAEAHKHQTYLRTMCGIDGWKAEATYSGTYLTVLGKIDLWEIYQKQEKPEFIQISDHDFTIGHEPYNGSGTCGPDQYKGAKRIMRAFFFVDGQSGYGVDSIFGLTGNCWKNDLRALFASDMQDMREAA